MPVFFSDLFLSFINVHFVLIGYQISQIVKGIYLYCDFVVCYNFTSDWISSFKCRLYKWH
jgi:hypothetical protein